jgi:hypothetical protein
MWIRIDRMPSELRGRLQLIAIDIWDRVVYRDPQGGLWRHRVIDEADVWEGWQ